MVRRRHVSVDVFAIYGFRIDSCCIGSLFLSAKDCPPAEVEMKDIEQQKIGLVADAGVVVEYQVSYWKRKD